MHELKKKRLIFLFAAIGCFLLWTVLTSIAPVVGAYSTFVFIPGGVVCILMRGKLGQQITKMLEPRYIDFHVVGTSFEDDGKSRQKVLELIQKKKEPFNKPFESKLVSFSYEGKPAYHVVVNAGFNDAIIGNISAQDVPVLDGLFRDCDNVKIAELRAVGGKINEYGEKTNYGAYITISYNERV